MAKITNAQLRQLGIVRQAPRYGPTPEDEFGALGVRLIVDYHINFKNCFTAEDWRNKLKEIIASHEEARKTCERGSPMRKRLSGKIKHLEVLVNSTAPERISNYANEHPYSVLSLCRFYDYKKAKEMLLSRVQPFTWIRSKVQKRKRYSDLHRRTD
jgi:hypothetical protein